MRTGKFCGPLRVVMAAAVASSAALCRAEYAEFDQNTDTIAILGETVLATSATFEAIVQLSDPAKGSVFREQGDGTELKSLSLSNTLLEGFAKWTLTDAGGFSAPATVSLDEFHHIAFVHTLSVSTKNQSLYLDGVLIGSRSESNPDNFINNVVSGVHPAAIGASQVNPANDPVAGFIGLLDSVRISKVARYAGPSFTPPTGDLTADANTLLLYNFNAAEVSGDTVTDVSGNGHTGTFGTGFTGATAPEFVAASNTADFNGNGVVDAADYVLWRKHDGLTGAATQSDGDADGDMDVDGADYGAWRATYGSSTAGSGSAGGTLSVPEPGALALSITATFLVFSLCRQRYSPLPPMRSLPTQRRRASGTAIEPSGCW